MGEDTAIAGVVLAAGEGTRFQEGNKLLLPFRGRAVIYHVVREALRSLLDSVFLVVGYERERLLEALEGQREDPKLRVLQNNRWRSGRASSVNAAIEALPGDAIGAIFLQGDMPLMTTELIDFVAERFVKTGVRICFPLHKGEKGHPVAFSRELLSELRRLRGDQSGQALVRAHWDEALKLTLDNGSTQLDLDTYEDYQRLLDREQG